jgi:hypothetical protein
MFSIIGYGFAYARFPLTFMEDFWGSRGRRGRIEVVCGRRDKGIFGQDPHPKGGSSLIFQGKITTPF